MREELFRFLQDCLVNIGKRDIRELRRFFENRGFRYFPYRDSEFFRHESRNEYFRNVPVSALHKALVFLDPDNGLEVASMRAENGNRYVKYDEAGTLSARMDDSSVLMLYQHLPRQNRQQFFFETAKKLSNYLHLQNLSLVSDNSVAFVILTKNGQRSHWLGKVLASYADAQGLLFTSGINLEDPEAKAAGK